jgi:hypothetical protein
MALTANNLLGSVNCKVNFSGRAVAKKGSTLDGFNGKAMMYSGSVYGDFSPGKVSVTAPGDSASNGTFVIWQNKMITAGTMVAGGFIVSDQFGGCDLTIVRDSSGLLYGMHVHRSKDSDARNYLGDFPVGWKLIGTWESRVYTQKWGEGKAVTIVPFVFAEGKQVKVVVIKIDNSGKITNAELANIFDNA